MSKSIPYICRNKATWNFFQLKLILCFGLEVENGPAEIIKRKVFNKWKISTWDKEQEEEDNSCLMNQFNVSLLVLL